MNMIVVRAVFHVKGLPQWVVMVGRSAQYKKPVIMNGTSFWDMWH